MTLELHEPVDAAAICAASGIVPPGFMNVSVAGQQSIARSLGYFGQERFVIFYYEARGQEVVWADGRTSGFGTGAWRVFFEEIDPLARARQVDVGCSGAPAEHALVLDRQWNRAWFARRLEAARFVARQG